MNENAEEFRKITMKVLVMQLASVTIMDLVAFGLSLIHIWSPRGAVLGTLAFGLADAVSIYIQAVSGSSVFPNELIIALPYILTILLTICRKNFNVPAKLGVPYSKES